MSNARYMVSELTLVLRYVLLMKRQALLVVTNNLRKIKEATVLLEELMLFLALVVDNRS